jgi:glycerol dehydrogenase-like iron-containing ADH family enzyme
MTIASAIETVRILNETGQATWNDSHSETVIEIGNHHVRSLLSSESEYMLIISSLANNFIDNPPSAQTFSIIFAIGSSFEANAAKELLRSYIKKPYKYFMAPMPLSNDSFCTNLCKSDFNDVSTQAHSSVYPDRIIIDTSLLTKLPKKDHLPGVGEAVGLIISLLDYHAANNIKLDMSEFENASGIISSLFSSIDEDYSTFIKKLAMSLLLKCLIMRANGNNAIAASGDHMVSYALESLKPFSAIKHGELVLLGSIFMLSAFPEWESTSLNLAKLIGVGIRNEIINLKHLQYLIENTEAIIDSAIASRPARKSMLTKINKQNVESIRVRLIREIGNA